METNDIASLKRAGRIAAEALQRGRRIVRPGMPVMSLLDQLEEYVKKKGAGLAFPAQSSINHIAAHACPETEEQTFKEGDVVKIDVGTHIDGWIADNAITIELGTEKNSEVIRASREALDAAIKTADVGVNTREIGMKIENAITKYGLKPVVNLSGHGLGRYEVHAPPSFPNIDTGRGEELKEGMTFAIEPFASTGSGRVADSGTPTVFMMQAKKPVRSAYSREILKTIESYEGLPFTSRWLSREHGAAKTRLAINELERMGIIHAYPPLADTGKGIVSQAEHTIHLGKKPIIITHAED